jgi:DNA polymerase-3 subunit gamma/tau
MTEAPGGAYRVLARKYRPVDFSGLIGQDAVVRTLANAFAAGRIAQAYMLTGVRGVGKTTTARLIARALNYPEGPTTDLGAFGPHCEAILESRHMDVIEMDAASNTGVDNMREIIESVRYAPVSARYKVYIIDEVHMLSKNAFNALLKTLEEPPPHVKFIFATTEIRKVPVTILSRCQRFDLRRLEAGRLVEHFRSVAEKEQVSAEDEALRLIARASEGSVRDGLSLLDQAIAYGNGAVRATDVSTMLGLIDRGHIIDLFEAVMGGDAPRALQEIESQYAAGGDPATILSDLADFVHWVTRLKIVREAALSDSTRTESERTRGLQNAEKIGMQDLTRAWQMLLKGVEEVKLAANPLMAAEMVLIRLAHAIELPAAEVLGRLAGTATSPERPQTSVPTQATRRSAEAPPAVKGPLALQAESASTTDLPATRARFSEFRDIVALATEKRDVRLRNDLERMVRPIRVADGQLEIALEQGASPGLPNEIARKLEAWTGRRWMVLVARDGGDKPLAVQHKEARETLFQEAREHPDVQSILKRFPGAEIVDVRDPEPQQMESDEESQ